MCSCRWSRWRLRGDQAATVVVRWAGDIRSIPVMGHGCRSFVAGLKKKVPQRHVWMSTQRK